MHRDDRARPCRTRAVLGPGARVGAAAGAAPQPREWATCDWQQKTPQTRCVHGAAFVKTLHSRRPNLQTWNSMPCEIVVPIELHKCYIDESGGDRLLGPARPQGWHVGMLYSIYSIDRAATGPSSTIICALTLMPLSNIVTMRAQAATGGTPDSFPVNSTTTTGLITVTPDPASNLAAGQQQQDSADLRIPVNANLYYSPHDTGRRDSRQQIDASMSRGTAFSADLNDQDTEFFIGPQPAGNGGRSSPEGA